MAATARYLDPEVHPELAASPSSDLPLSMKSVLLTGGAGTLGTELQKHFRNARFLKNITIEAPRSKDFDVTNYDGMRRYIIEQFGPQLCD